METKETTIVSYEKLLKAQMEIGAIKKDSDNPYFKSKYFDINAILREVKPILNKHGLVVVQPLKLIDGKNGLYTAIVDASTGEAVIESTCLLPDTLKAQETGSAITYFRRYAIQSLLSLEAEDDDGNVASGKTKVAKTPAQKFDEELDKDLKVVKNEDDF